MKRWIYLVVLAAAVLAAGCSKATMPDTVTISRSSEGDVVPPSERTVTDQTLVESLYASLLALPPLKPDLLRGCPPVPGFQVRLTFLHAGKPIVTAAADTGGCQTVRLDDGRMFDTMAPDGANFWSLVIKATETTK